MDLKTCDAIKSQSQCCGMSTSDGVVTEKAKKNMGDEVLSNLMSEIVVPFKKDFESRFEAKEDKCTLYEKAFRAAMKFNTFDPHAKVDRK
jgi:hypothetical protein